MLTLCFVFLHQERASDRVNHSIWLCGGFLARVATGMFMFGEDVNRAEVANPYINRMFVQVERSIHCLDPQIAFFLRLYLLMQRMFVSPARRTFNVCRIPCIVLAGKGFICVVILVGPPGHT